MQIEQLIVGHMGVCCYIIGCEKTKEAAVIDAGGDENRIAEIIEKNGYDLKYIIATHGHSDHVCGNRLLRGMTDAKIVMHEDDAEFFGKPSVLQYFAAFGLEHSPEPDIKVKDGDIIEIGEVKLEVIHTPGHTPGGMCLYNAPNVFTGDTLFAGGVGRTDFPGGDHHTLFESINNRLFVLPDETVVWPGHGYGGNSSTIGIEKKDNPYL